VFAYDDLHLAWSPRGIEDITPETLAALEVLEPKPDLLIIGTGKSILSLGSDVMKYLKSLDVAVDVADTGRATSTFNVLVEEGRCVAAALLPAGYVVVDP
jgi:NADH dehydrogenase [ubiquinone] 1 alpha subcomplex assembly factor 3